MNMLKLLYLAKLMAINLKYYIANNASLMMSPGYPQILASGYPDSKFTIRFSPYAMLVACYWVADIP